MVEILDTRKMTRAERLAAMEESQKRHAVERAQRQREHAARNAAAVKAAEEWTSLSPDERARRRAQEREAQRQRHEQANSAASEERSGEGPPENKMLLPPVQNKAPAKPRAAKKPAAPAKAPAKAPAPTEPPDATDAAVTLAKKHRIDLKKVKGTGSGGRITVSDVGALIP